MHSIENIQVYLDRMSRPLAEKLKVAKYIPSDATAILDVGCADGVVTSALAEIFPTAGVLGIDLNEEFINIAKERYQQPNLEFEKVYLRDLLSRGKTYDAVVFCSVLHEFFTYGEGISSVLKALSDAHEILKVGGRLIIRDMILFDYSKKATLYTDSIMQKIREREDAHFIADFENKFGKMDSTYKINHYLLKYWYKENWERESVENYVPVTFEQYESIFSLLGMKVQIKDSSTLPFLEEKWAQDFNLTSDEILTLCSTGFLVAEKL